MDIWCVSIKCCRQVVVDRGTHDMTGKVLFSLIEGNTGPYSFLSVDMSKSIYYTSWAGVYQFIIIWQVKVCRAAKLVEVCAHQLTLKEQITVCIIFQAAAGQIALGSQLSQSQNVFAGPVIITIIVVNIFWHYSLNVPFLPNHGYCQIVSNCCETHSVCGENGLFWYYLFFDI